MKNEVETVLANWIEMAISAPGELPSGVSPACWVTEKFLRWWRSDFENRLDECLEGAESALNAIHGELIRIGKGEEFGEALHECKHLAEALQGLRRALLIGNR